MVNHRPTGLGALYLKRLRLDVEIKRDPFTLCIPFHLGLERLLPFERKQWGFPGQDSRDVVFSQILPQYLLRKPYSGMAWDFIPGAFVDDRLSCNRTERFRDSIRVSPAGGLEHLYLLLEKFNQVFQKRFATFMIPSILNIFKPQLPGRCHHRLCNCSHSDRAKTVDEKPPSRRRP